MEQRAKTPGQVNLNKSRDFDVFEMQLIISHHLWECLSVFASDLHFGWFRLAAPMATEPCVSTLSCLFTLNFRRS